MFKVEYSMTHCDIFAEWDDFLEWMKDVNKILREQGKLEVDESDFEITEIYPEYTMPEDFVKYDYFEISQKNKGEALN